MTDESSPPEDAAAPLPPKSEAKTTQRFLKARQAQKSGLERPGSTSDVRDMYTLRLREPPAARRSLFRRLLITTLAVLATYGALTQLLAYRLGAQVLSDTFQQQLVDPTVTSLEDVLGNMLGSEPPQEPIQTYLDRRFGGMRRLTVAVYTPEGELIAQAVGVPGAAPDKLEAYAQQKVSEGARYRQSRDLGFVAVGPIRRGPPPTSGSSPLLGFVRVAGQPSAQRTLNLIWEASWRWALPVFLLAALTAYLGTRSITHRLREAEHAVRRIAAGDQNARIPVGEMDEVGRVAYTFNRTVDLLERTLSDLEQTDAIRRRQVADFAHELNTPLTNVIAYLDTLIMGDEEGGMDAQTRNGFLQVARDEADRLSHLARDLETLTKLEAGRLVLEREVVDVSKVAVELARRIIPRAEGQGLEVLTDIEPGGEIVGDRMRLEQVGMNLLENALRYTTEGSITVAVHSVNEGVVLSVRDTGIGIPEDDVENVMSRFYRVDPSRNRSTGGSGLGLAIVGRIVQRHGGHVGIESALGEGTCVSVHFPREGTLTVEGAIPNLDAHV